MNDRRGQPRLERRRRDRHRASSLAGEGRLEALANVTARRTQQLVEQPNRDERRRPLTDEQRSVSASHQVHGCRAENARQHRVHVRLGGYVRQESKHVVLGRLWNVWILHGSFLLSAMNDQVWNGPVTGSRQTGGTGTARRVPPPSTSPVPPCLAARCCIMAALQREITPRTPLDRGC